MAVIGDLVVNVSGNASGLSSSLARASAQVRGFNTTVGTVGSQVSSSFGMMAVKAGGLAAAVVSVSAAFRGLHVAMDAFIQRQGTLIGFEKLLGDASEAASLMERLEKFALATPFSMEETTQVATGLLSQFKPDEVMDIISIVGDLAAVLPTTSMQELGLVVAQSAAEFKVMTKDLRQFTSKGIPLLQAFVDEGIAKTSQEVFALAEAGEITFPLLLRMLRKIRDEKFAGAAEEMAHSFGGLLTMLKDSAIRGAGRVFGELVNIIGIDLEGAVDSVGAMFEGLVNWMQENQESLKVWGGLIKEIGGLFLELAKIVAKTFGAVLIGTALQLEQIISKISEAISKLRGFFEQVNGSQLMRSLTGFGYADKKSSGDVLGSVIGFGRDFLTGSSAAGLAGVPGTIPGIEAELITPDNPSALGFQDANGSGFNQEIYEQRLRAEAEAFEALKKENEMINSAYLGRAQEWMASISDRDPQREAGFAGAMAQGSAEAYSTVLKSINNRSEQAAIQTANNTAMTVAAVNTLTQGVTGAFGNITAIASLDR